VVVFFENSIEIRNRRKAYGFRNFKYTVLRFFKKLFRFYGRDTGKAIADLLTVYDETGLQKASWRNNNIDWTKTRAYPVDTCYVNVNLAGREPCGIVKPEDYDSTVAEIIRALQVYNETDKGTRGLAFALRKEEAGFVGHSPEDCGDVIFGINGSRAGGQIGGVHAVQIPTACNLTGGSMQPIFILSGKNIKKDVTLTRPADLTDIAPTLCYAAGYPQPKDATGGVIFAVFQEEL
jgi:predicted AlkP superfamily phosphohydrolase/phosphomutase